MNNNKKLQVIWLHYWHNCHAKLWITKGVWPYPLQNDVKEEKLHNRFQSSKFFKAGVYLIIKLIHNGITKFGSHAKVI